MNIGKLERVELRDLWKHEEYDFSAWLAEESNLEMLSDSIGIDLSLIETEAKCGGFSIDILAEEVGSGKKVIIENQLEDTNHDHLGKIITYASGKDASYVIWIVKHARDEHRRAIEWLNEHTDSEVSFFLLEIELWKIGDSLPAPKFNIVEWPNDWSKEEKKSTAEVSERGLLCQEFWEGFNQFAKKNVEFTKSFSIRKAKPHHWYDLAIGASNAFISMNIKVAKGAIDSGLYIPDDQKYFDSLGEHAEEIEQILGCEVEWRQARKACRIIASRPFDCENREAWQDAFAWYMEIAPKLKQISRIVKK